MALFLPPATSIFLNDKCAPHGGTKLQLVMPHSPYMRLGENNLDQDQGDRDSMVNSIASILEFSA